MKSDLQKLRELTDRLPMLGLRRQEESLRVLVLEGEKSINRLVIETLEYFGCKCSSVMNSKEASAIIEKEQFDVLLANIRLEENTEGLLMVKMFQSKHPQAIVIIMSSDEDRLYSYSKYFSTLAMPFGIYDLVKKVSNGLVREAK